VLSTREIAERKDVVRVVEQLTKSSCEGLCIERLGAGRQANVYFAKTPNEQPIWRCHRSLVIKLYKPAIGSTVEQVRGQFEALFSLYAFVNGYVARGWRIFVPAPLFVCQSPLALVMTMVPGKRLDEYFEANNDATADVLKSASKAIVDAMEPSWSSGHPHGDLQLHNILCNVEERELVFLDAGQVKDRPGWDANTISQRAAAHDLAYLLYEAGVSVRNPLGAPGGRLRQQRFTESILRSFIVTIGSIEERHRLIEEVRSQARRYLDMHVCTSWSPALPWRIVLRTIAKKRIDAIVRRLRANAITASAGWVQGG
jgi:tRNA A-37 threonylcarbamoyl transferase component Bud32